MKLRLPKKLSAALIASITVGLTLSQVEAATKYSTPTYGGAEYVWHGDHWEYPEGTRVNNIARVGGKGGVMVIDDAGTVSNSVHVQDTSDYGGVKVLGDTIFTTSLGWWAGSIYVGAEAALNASYVQDLKTTEQGNAATVYVDGTLAITDRRSLGMNDGNGSHNWYIGEEGFINLSGITGVYKGNRAWNIQLSVDEGTPFDLTGYTNRTLGGQLTKKFMSTGADLYDQVDSFAVFLEGAELASTAYTINHYASGMSVSYDVAATIKNMDLTWAGGEDTWEVKGTHWKDGAGTATSFASGDSVTFTGSGNKANVSGAVEANAITVNGGTTIDTTAAGASLKANSLTITDGSTLTVQGTGALSVKQMLQGQGTLALGAGAIATVATLSVGEGQIFTVEGEGAELSVTSLSSAGILNIGSGACIGVGGNIISVVAGTSFNVSGQGTLAVETLCSTGGTLNISSNMEVAGGGNGEGSSRKEGLAVTGDNGVVSITGGVTTVTGATYTGARETVLNVGTGKTDAVLVTHRLELGDYASTSTGLLNIGVHGKVVVTSDRNDTSAQQYAYSGLVFSEWGQSTNAQIDGNLYARDAVLEVGDSAAYINVTGILATKGVYNAYGPAGHISLEENGKIIIGASGITANTSSSATKWTMNLNGGEIGITADSNIDNDLNVMGDVTFNTAMYTWEGEGANLELVESTGGGTLTVSGNITGAGSITKIGDGSLVLEGANNELNNTIDVQGGTLQLDGIFAIDGNERDMRISYTGASLEGNGFMTASGHIVVYTVTNDANVTLGNAAQITYAGEDVKNKLSDGVYTAEEETFYSTFYVNRGAENVFQALKAADMENIVLKNGTTLNVDADFASSRIGVDTGTATVNISTGKTLSGTIQNAVVTGSGTYALNSSTPDLGVGTSLDENWTGTVRIGGFSADSSTRLSNFANGNASTVEIYGITGGYLPEYAGGTMGANIKLTNPDSSTPAWIWSNGGNYTITFSGDWSGDGAFRKSGYYNQSFAFSGDISEWRGAFELLSSYTTNLTFKGDATKVNAAISKPGAGTLNIITGDVQSDFDITFGNNVTASSLQIKENASATLKGETAIGTISGEGTLIVDSGANTVSVSNGGTLGSTITVQSGTLMLAGIFAIDGITGADIISDYVNAAGETSASGFSRKSGTIPVYTGSADTSEASFTFVNQPVAVIDGLCHIDSIVDYSTLWVNEETLNYGAYKTAAGESLTKVILANDTSINMDAAGATLSIKLTGASATVNATEVATITSVEGWSDNSLTISGEGAVTLLNQNITMSGTSVLDVQGNVTTGKIQLNSDDARLTVGSEGVLTIASNTNLTLTQGEANIFGTVNLSHELDLSDGQRSTGKLILHAGAEMMVTTGLWMNHTSGGILLAEGAMLTITGKNVKFTGKEGGSIKVVPDREINYATTTENAVISNLTMTALNDITIGNTLIKCDVVTGAHAVTLSNAASTYGDITVSEGGRLIANADLNISGTLKLAAGSSVQGSVINIGDKVSVRSMDGSGVQIGAGTDISETEMHGVEGKGVLENVSMETSANYTIKDMSISGSLIDVGEGTTLYLVNVGIHSDTHITDEAAWLDMQATQGWLNHDNTQVVKEYTTEQDITLFKSGDTGRSITLAAGSEIVELTSSMFDSVTLTGTDLWLDMIGIAEATYGKDYFTLDFKNLAHSLENAQVDVDHLHVYVTLDGERYTEAYSTASGGLTTTLYFAVPEPATGTLSLLTLAALAARRRRK